jgi:ParB family chromosome partitioning protein
VSKERRLGRGLEALLGRSANDPLQAANASTHETEDREGDATVTTLATDNESSDITRSEDGQSWLKLKCIVRNPYQPRKHFDESEIADLCDSIRTHGFLQPIVVRKAEDHYQLIAGERRLRAAQLASWERIPVQVREVEDRQMAELAIVENVQRKDLNALEKAASFQRYLEEYGSTQEELASRVNVDRSTVANLIRLLDLPEEVKQMLINKKITKGHARALLPLGEEDEQLAYAQRIYQEGLSVRAVEDAVRDHIRRTDQPQLSVVGGDGVSRPATPSRSEHLITIEQKLRLELGTKVDLRQSSRGRGKITIHFKSNEEFERIRSQLCNNIVNAAEDGQIEAG